GAILVDDLPRHNRAAFDVARGASGRREHPSRPTRILPGSQSADYKFRAGKSWRFVQSLVKLRRIQQVHPPIAGRDRDQVLSLVLKHDRRGSELHSSLIRTFGLERAFFESNQFSATDGYVESSIWPRGWTYRSGHAAIGLPVRNLLG